MKKFNFTLQSLKKYNDQMLDSEKSVLGRLRAELAEMQAELDAKTAEYELSIDKLNELVRGASELTSFPYSAFVMAIPPRPVIFR